MSTRKIFIVWLRRRCHAPGMCLTTPVGRRSARWKPTGSIPTTRRSQRTRVGTMPSTICGFDRGSAVSVSATGGAMRPSGQLLSVRRSWLTAVTPRTWCRCILSTAWSDGCCLASQPRLPIEAFACVGHLRAGRAASYRADGRLAVFGAGAARLHEEVIPITAIWTESERDRKSLRPLGESGEEKTLNQLEDALRERP